MSTAELQNFAPGFPWAAFFAGAKVPPQKRLIVNEKTAIPDLAAIYAQTPLATLKEWEAFHTTESASPYLNKAMVDSRFDFIKTISGVTEQRPRWKRAVWLVDGSLGELAGQDYVARYFPPESKAKMVELVANLKTAMAARIQGNGWMSSATKTAALDKLSRMDVMVGYPDKFRDYSALEIRPDDLYGNVQRANRFNADYEMEDLDKPVDRKKWGMTPQTVNAYNGGGENKIVFPAGILQPPFFDPTRTMQSITARSARSSATRSATASTTRDASSTRPAPSVTGGPRRTTSASTRSQGLRRPICEVRGGAWSVHQSDADDGREYRRLRRHPGRARRLSSVAGRQAGAGDRRPDRRPALLPRLCAGVAREEAA